MLVLLNYKSLSWSLWFPELYSFSDWVHCPDKYELETHFFALIKTFSKIYILIF